MAGRYLRLAPEAPLPRLDDPSPYKAVVVVEADVAPRWRADVSRWLAETGCRFMMAWGRDCSIWHDSVDEANLEQFGCGEIPSEAFIMTTWHDKEPLSEVFWYAKYAASHSDLDLRNVLFLHIGAANRREEFERLYRDA